MKKSQTVSSNVPETLHHLAQFHGIASWFPTQIFSKFTCLPTKVSYLYLHLFPFVYLCTSDCVTELFLIIYNYTVQYYKSITSYDLLGGTEEVLLPEVCELENINRSSYYNSMPVCEIISKWSPNITYFDSRLHNSMKIGNLLCSLPPKILRSSSVSACSLYSLTKTFWEIILIRLIRNETKEK